MQSKHVSKDNWVDLFREIGLNDDAMTRWHQLFEQRNPNSHQEFLEWLNIPDSEIAEIRSL